MIKFEKNIEQLLPYDRKDYNTYFDEDSKEFNRNVIWHAVSLQQPAIRGKQLYVVSEHVISNSFNHLEKAFRNIVSEFDKALPWIINHDDKDFPWLNNQSSALPKMKSLFKERSIPTSFIGCLIFYEEDLVNFARELISYAYLLSYKNLDVSHSKLPFIIKLTGHLTLDLLSTDKKLLTDILDSNIFDSFLKIPYRSRQ